MKTFIDSSLRTQKRGFLRPCLENLSQSASCCSCICSLDYTKVKIHYESNMMYHLTYCLQTLDLSLGTCVLWTKLTRGLWVTMVFIWWISLTLMSRSSVSLLALLLGLSRGHREITSSSCHSHVTGMTSCSTFSHVEVSTTSSRSSKFSPNISRTWCLCWRRTEVRDLIESVCRYHEFCQITNVY